MTAQIAITFAGDMPVTVGGHFIKTVTQHVKNVNKLNHYLNKQIFNHKKMPNQTQLNPGLQALIVAGIIVIFAVCYLLCWMWLNSPQRDISQDRDESLFLHSDGVSHNEDVKVRLARLKKRLAIQREEAEKAKEALHREVSKFNEGRSGKYV